MPKRHTTSCRSAGVQGAREIMPDYRRGTIVSCTAGDGACAVTLWYSNTYALRQASLRIDRGMLALPAIPIDPPAQHFRAATRRTHARTHA